MDALQGLAILGLVLMGAGGVALVAIVGWLAVADDRGVWTVAELAAIPRPAGRHRAVAQFPAEQVPARPGWVGLHAEDEVPPSIRSVTMELPIIERARVLAWEHGITRRPTYPAPARLRRVQLFVFQEIDPPHLVTVVEPDETALRIGDQLNRRALEVYRDCAEADVWPAHTGDNEIPLVSLPGWVERQYEQPESWEEIL